MFAGEDEREIQRLQNLLNRCRWEKQQLETQAKAKDELIATLSAQNAGLQCAQRRFASGQVYQEPEASWLQQKISRLEQFAKEQAYESNYLEQSQASLMHEVEALQQSVCAHQASGTEKDLMLESLMLKIKELQDVRKIQEEQIQTLNNSVKAHCARKLKLTQENATLSAKMRQERADRQSQFKLLFQGLNVLTSEMRHREEGEAVDAAGDKVILQLQQEELQERNEEIMRLGIILDGVQLPAEEAHLRNTIKHLRGELARYNRMATAILQKQQVAQATIKTHAELMKKYEMEIEHIAELKLENQNLKSRLNAKQVQLNELLESVQGQRESEKETKSILVQVLKQNQCYHELMQESYGSSYEFYIEKSRAEYMQRLAQRVKREKWASVDELVDVNSKMRKRLQAA